MSDFEKWLKDRKEEFQNSFLIPLLIKKIVTAVVVIAFVSLFLFLWMILR